MFPVAKYNKLLIIKHAYRNSVKLVYTLTFSIHLQTVPFCSTCTSKQQSLCLTVNYIFKEVWIKPKQKDIGILMKSLERTHMPTKSRHVCFSNSQWSNVVYVHSSHQTAKHLKFLTPFIIVIYLVSMLTILLHSTIVIIFSPKKYFCVFLAPIHEIPTCL